MKKSAGFTLVELLIVLGIIAILIGVSALSLGILRQRGRDAQRQSDLRTIQAALQQYYADMGFYPAYGSLQQGPPSPDVVTTLTSSTGNPNCVPTPNANCPNPEVVYLPVIPVDPQLTVGNNSIHYCYQAQGSVTDTGPCDNNLTDGDLEGMCFYYSLYTTLEVNTGNTYGCVDRSPEAQPHVHNENFVVHPL